MDAQLRMGEHARGKGDDLLHDAQPLSRHPDTVTAHSAPGQPGKAQAKARKKAKKEARKKQRR